MPSTASGPIHLNLRLEHSAQAHSGDMAEHHDFSHTGSAGASWIARIRYWGYSGDWIGENLAVGNITARTVMAMWKASPPHRANLLNGHFARGRDRCRAGHVLRPRGDLRHHRLRRLTTPHGDRRVFSSAAEAGAVLKRGRKRSIHGRTIAVSP